MKHRQKHLLHLITGIILGSYFYCPAATADSPEDILIIANKNLKEKTITLNEIRAIYKKTRKNWSDGGKIVPIHAVDDTTLRTAFQRLVLFMNKAEEKAYWNNQKARGHQGAPVSIRNAQKAVFHLKRSVAYVFRKDFISTVAKVLLVIPNP